MAMRVYRGGKYIARKYPAVKRRYNVYAPAVKQLASDVMYLKGLINSEPQPFVVQSQQNFDWNGVIVPCSNIVQGDQEGQRTGNRVLPRYFSLNVHINQDTAGTAIMHATHRMIVFRFWGENANAVGTTTPGEVLATIGNAFAPMSHLRSTITGPKGDRNRRIEVLRNEQITLDQVSRTCVDLQYNIEMNGKGKSQKEHIEFFNNATAEPVSGGIYVLFISSHATAANQQFTMESRLTFYDN